MTKILAGLLLLALPTILLAEDTDPCPPGLICASNPIGVAEAMRKAGFQAKLEADSTGDPSISSAAAGYTYDVFFYGCKDKRNCDSLQFRISFKADSTNTPALANEWNVDKRFGQAAIDSKGNFIIGMDVTTVGGLTPKNFEDVLAWWNTTLGNVDKFWKENPGK